MCDESNSCSSGSSGIVECSACGHQLEYGHGGIQCVQGHHLCLDTCASQWIDVVLAEPTISIPAKCPTCKVEIKEEILHRVMNLDQLEQYVYYTLQLKAKQLKQEGETLCMCSFCNYFEYRKCAEVDVFLVHCQRETCNKVTCFVCKGELGNDDCNDDLEFHMKCIELGSLKKRFDDTILAGITMPCPSCGLGGMKDDACSHMVCPNCGVEWCYVGGKDLKDVDKAGSDIYGHFENWKTNSKRCPMYIYQIHEVDESYSDDATEAMEMFHKNRTAILLKKFLEEIGESQFAEMHNHFESIKNCGFTISDIKTAPAIMYSGVKRAWGCTIH